jgi:hypothetical protein
MSDSDEAAVTADAGIPIRRATWVLIRDGVVEQVKRGCDFLLLPFEQTGEVAYVPPLDGRPADIPRAGLAVFPATGQDVQPGYLVDAKGNFTPPEGRTGPIAAGLPAYHQGPGTMQRSGDTTEMRVAMPDTPGADCNDTLMETAG